MLGSLGPMELAIIALIVILLFGAGKISGLGKDVGTSIKEFRKAVKDDDAKPTQTANTQQQPPAAPAAPQEPPAAQQPPASNDSAPKVF